MSLGSIIAAGRAGGDSLRRSYVAALSGMPNFTDIYRTALNTRSAERVANTRAESTVAQAGIRANTRTKLAEMGAEYGEKIANEKLGARKFAGIVGGQVQRCNHICLLYTSPSPRDRTRSRMPSSA